MKISIEEQYKRLRNYIEKKTEPIVKFLKGHGVNTVPKVWWVYAFVFFLVFYGYYYGKIYDYITENYDDKLRKLYNALGNVYLNWLFLIGVIYLSFVAGKAICKDRLFSWKRLFIEILAIFTLTFHNQWVFAKLPLFGNYQGLLIVILATLILLEVLKYRWHKKPEQQTPIKNYHYISDDDFNAEEDYQRRVKLADEIVKRALATDISKESFSIGITGGWGTGKTTMLESIKKAIGDKAYVVEFNPWNSQSASQIIADFFSDIRSCLSSNYRTLAKPIMRYANLLADVEMNPVEKWLVSKVTGYAEKDLSGRKQLLSKELKKLDRPLVVLIDDTDRLESDEMFEVLRLVRNTAKLPNVIYFVAFDKSYLVAQLAKKEIPDAAQYVEKIFPLEIAMPYAEKHLLISALYYDINQMSKNENLINWLYQHISYDEMTKAVEILGSYRQVKRFSRIYITELSYMRSMFTKTELSLTDLFWLTLIQLTDHEVYETMFRSPDKYLSLETGTNIRTYKVSEQIKNVKDNTKRILNILFSNSNGNVVNGIRYADNYYNYFYMGLEKGRISIEDFGDLMKLEADIDSKMVELCTKKTPQSIYHRLSAFPLNKDENIERLKNYFTALTSWMNLQEHHLMRFMLKDRLTTFYVKEEDRETMRQWFVQRITAVINTTDKFQQFAEALTNLYPMYPTDIDEEYGVKKWHVLGADDIRNLCKLIFKKYLVHNPEEDAYDILDKGTRMGRLYRTFSITTDYYAPDDVSDIDNFVIDEVIDYFSHHKSNKYEKAKRRFDLTDEDRRSGYSDEISQSYQEDKMFLFGSNGDKYDEYLNKCFINVINS